MEPPPRQRRALAPTLPSLSRLAGSAFTRSDLYQDILRRVDDWNAENRPNGTGPRSLMELSMRRITSRDDEMNARAGAIIRWMDTTGAGRELYRSEREWQTLLESTRNLVTRFPYTLDILRLIIVMWHYTTETTGYPFTHTISVDLMRELYVNLFRPGMPIIQYVSDHIRGNNLTGPFHINLGIQHILSWNMSHPWGPLGEIL